MTSYLCANEAQNLRNGDFQLAQVPDFGISREPFGTLRSVSAHFFFIFRALSFELNLSFERSCPLSKEKRREGDQLIIGDILIRSSPKYSC